MAALWFASPRSASSPPPSAAASATTATSSTATSSTPQAISDVKPGQTAEQVLVTMGTPSTTSTVGGSAWYYIQQKSERPIAFMKPKLIDQRVYAVYFDKQKRVIRSANYGMQDGRIVDFAAGATPTIGADNNFLKGIFLNFNPLQSLMQNG